MLIQPTLLERFWGQVDKSGDCWLWSAGKDRNGYGRLRWNGRYSRAHRISWELHGGPIPDGFFVCHHCDNPPCVRPEHLFLGTPQDNMADRDAKGRQARGDRHNSRLRPESLARGLANGRYTKPESTLRGSANGFAKLTEEQVLEIRRMYASGNWSQQSIANRFGVNQTMVGFIVRRVKWAHI